MTDLRLSPRQREVLYWISLGKTDRDIALILSVSEATVECHVRRAMRALDSVTRTQAVVKALRRGIIE